MRTYRAGRVSVERGEIGYTLEGPQDGPIVIFSNSLGATSVMWDREASWFAERWQILRYDTRGHGSSSVAPGAYSIDLLGGDVLSLMDALGVEKAGFCGLSLGGMIGQWLGSEAPERFSALVLANTSAFMGQASAWQARIAAVRSGGMPAVATAIVDRWFTVHFREAFPDLVDAFRAILLSTPPEGYASCCAAIRDMDLRPLLQTISVPTLVIAGLRDQATPVDHSRVLASRIANARYAALNAAHLSNVEAPDAFRHLIDRFLTNSLSTNLRP